MIYSQNNQHPQHTFARWSKAFNEGWTNMSYHVWVEASVQHPPDSTTIVHELYPLEDWQEDVRIGDTTLGYLEWRRDKEGEDANTLFEGQMEITPFYFSMGLDESATLRMEVTAEDGTVVFSLEGADIIDQPYLQNTIHDLLHLTEHLRAIDILGPFDELVRR